MRNHPFASIYFALLLALPPTASGTPSHEACRFEKLNIQQGMSRAQVEQKVAVLRGESSTYNLYQNDLRGGSVEHRFEGCVLTIEYTPGSLPPYVMGPGGVTQHMAPMDEAVKMFMIRREGKLPKNERDRSLSSPCCRASARVSRPVDDNNVSVFHR